MAREEKIKESSCHDDDAVASCSSVRILGGRDLKRGGARLAINGSGRFAVVTNYSIEKVRGAKSRGALVTNFLKTSLSPVEYLQRIQPRDYAGFSLFVYDDSTSTLAFLTNRDETRVGPQVLPPGLYGVSNGTLNKWEKVSFLKNGLAWLEAEGRMQSNESLFSLLTYGRNTCSQMQSVSRSSSCSIPSLVASDYNEETESEQDYSEDASQGECFLGSIFEDDPFDDLPLEKTKPFLFRPEKGYGTRCSMVVLCNQKSQWTFIERRFDHTGANVGETFQEFNAKDANYLTIYIANNSRSFVCYSLFL